LGHAVDFVVSMTFFRSAVFAIFAITLSPDRNVPPAHGPRFYLEIWEYRSLDGQLWMTQPARTRCTVLASRILHELSPRSGIAILCLALPSCIIRWIGRVGTPGAPLTKKGPAFLRGRRCCIWCS